MGYTVLYIAFGMVALWLLGEVLLQYKARLRWRLLAFAGFTGLAGGVYLREIVVIALGAAAFAVGQTLVTMSYRRGLSTGWALGGRPGASRRRRSGRPAPSAEPTLEVSPVEPVPDGHETVGHGDFGNHADQGAGNGYGYGTDSSYGTGNGYGTDSSYASDTGYGYDNGTFEPSPALQPSPTYDGTSGYGVHDDHSSYTPDPYDGVPQGYAAPVYGEQGDWSAGRPAAHDGGLDADQQFHDTPAGRQAPPLPDERPYVPQQPQYPPHQQPQYADPQDPDRH